MTTKTRLEGLAWVAALFAATLLVGLLEFMIATLESPVYVEPSQDPDYVIPQDQ